MPVSSRAYTRSHYGNSVSVAWSSHNRTRTWVELWVEHCVWLISPDSIQTTGIWTKLECVNNFTTTGKYLNFVVIKNNYRRTNEGKPYFDDFPTSQIRWEISPIYPITIGSYLTALLSVLPWNQLAWICSRFTISWFILALQSLKVRASSLAYTNTKSGSVEFFLGPKFRGKTLRLYSNLRKSCLFHFL